MITLNPADVANNANMAALISIGKASAGKSNAFDIMSAKAWWKLSY